MTLTPRVLQVAGRMDRAGAETAVMNLYRHMDRGAIQFDFLEFGEGKSDYSEEIEALGGRIYSLARSKPLGAASAALGLTRLLDAHKEIKGVHSHTGLSTSIHLSAAALAGVSCRVAHIHSARLGREDSAVGHAYEIAARSVIGRVATTRIACGMMAGERAYGGRDFVVIPNAVDVALLARENGPARTRLRQEFGVGREFPILLQVGRLIETKNQAFSLRVAQSLRSLLPNFLLLLAGRGPALDEIRIGVRRLGLENCTRILGNRDDVPDLLLGADVMLMPSLYEGFPMVLVEAQAAGIPTVLSDSISREVDLGVGLCRFLSLKRPASEWALETLSLLEQRPNIAIGARRRVLAGKGYDAAAAAEKLATLYQSQGLAE